MEVQKPTSPVQISDDDDDGTGIHRSYLCIFCRRGFCTAQALGGHMNIHRKDRVKIMKQKLTEEYTSSNHYLLYQDNSNLSQLSFFSPEVLKRRHSELRLFGDDHGRRDGMGEKDMRMKRDEEEEGGLDLELRLGLQPSN